MSGEKKDTSNFDLSSDEDQNLDDLINEEAQSNDGDDNVISDDNGKKKRNIIIGTSSGVIAALIVGSIFLFNPFGSGGFFKDSGTSARTPSATQQAQTPQVQIIPEGQTDESFADSNPIPFKVADWQKETFSAKNTNTLLKDAVKTDSGSNLAVSSGTLPSEAAGFTSDPSKAQLSDGTINPMFSYWTAEQFSGETRLILERLLNPRFGDWMMYEWGDSDANHRFNVQQFSDIFTARFMNGNAGKPYSEWVPVFADWNSNDYGMSKVLLVGGASRWFGQVTSSSTSFVYNDTTKQYTANFKANVVFTAWTKDQKKVQKHGVLTLKLVSNADNLNSSNNRVLVDGGSLKVG